MSPAPIPMQPSRANQTKVKYNSKCRIKTMTLDLKSLRLLCSGKQPRRRHFYKVAALAKKVSL